MDETKPSDLASEYYEVEVNFYRPSTIPFQDFCLACDLRKRMADPDDEPRSPGFFEAWARDMRAHFYREHKFTLTQRYESERYGVPVLVAGPHVEYQLAVRYRVIADDSPIKGKVVFTHIDTGLDAARAHARIYLDAPDKFADVAVVSRVVEIADWKEEEWGL